MEDNETQPITLDELVKTANSSGITLDAFRKIMHNVALRIAKNGYIYRNDVEMLVKGNNVEVLIGREKR